MVREASICEGMEKARTSCDLFDLVLDEEIDQRHDRAEEQSGKKFSVFDRRFVGHRRACYRTEHPGDRTQQVPETHRTTSPIRRSTDAKPNEVLTRS